MSSEPISRRPAPPADRRDACQRCRLYRAGALVMLAMLAVGWATGWLR